MSWFNNFKKLFGSFSFTIKEEPKEEGVLRETDSSIESKIYKPDKESGQTDEVKDEGFQKRRTCQFLVVFPKTLNVDSDTKKREYKKKFDEERLHEVKLFEKSQAPPEDLFLSMESINRKEQLHQHKEFYLNVKQSAETINTENLDPHFPLNSEQFQYTEKERDLMSNSISTKPCQDDKLFKKIDENLDKLRGFFNGKDQNFMENSTNFSSGPVSKGKERKSTPLMNISSPIHHTFNENQSDYNQFCDMKFFNSANIISKRKRNFELYDEDLMFKMEENFKDSNGCRSFHQKKKKM